MVDVILDFEKKGFTVDVEFEKNSIFSCSISKINRLGKGKLFFNSDKNEIVMVNKKPRTMMFVTTEQAIDFFNMHLPRV